MSWFRREKAPTIDYSPEEYEPVIRSSICTGERTGCLRRREDGRLREIMLLRDEADLAEFGRLVGQKPEAIPTIY